MMLTTGFIIIPIVFIASLMVTEKYLGHYGIKGKRYSMPIAHTITVMLFAIFYFSLFGNASGMGAIPWVIPTVYDGPLVLLYPMLAQSHSDLIAIYALVLGGTEYALFGWIWDLLVSKERRELYPSKKTFIVLMMVALMGGAWLYSKMHYIILPDQEKSLIAYKKAKSKKDKFEALGFVVIDYYNAGNMTEAKKYAKLILDSKFKLSKDINYYTYRYDAYNILGLIALKNNNIQKALEYLKVSVDVNLTKAERTKCTSGPNMDLADRLYQLGYKDEVLKFLVKCESLHSKRMDNHKNIKMYIDRIERGENPNFDHLAELY